MQSACGEFWAFRSTIVWLCFVVSWTLMDSYVCIYFEWMCVCVRCQIIDLVVVGFGPSTSSLLVLQTQHTKPWKCELESIFACSFCR